MVRFLIFISIVTRISSRQEHPNQATNSTYWQAHCGPEKKFRASFRNRGRPSTFPRPLLPSRTLNCSWDRFSFRGHSTFPRPLLPPRTFSCSRDRSSLRGYSVVPKVAHPFEDTQLFPRPLLFSRTLPSRELLCSWPYRGPLLTKNFHSEQDSYNNRSHWSPPTNSYNKRLSWFSPSVTQPNSPHDHKILSSYRLRGFLAGDPNNHAPTITAVTTSHMKIMSVTPYVAQTLRVYF